MAQKPTPTDVICSLEENRASVYRRSVSILRNIEEAQDITQDTLVQVFVHSRDFQAQASLKTWTLAIASNLCFNRLRLKRWKQCVAFPEDALTTNESTSVLPSQEQVEKEMAFQQLIAATELCGREGKPRWDALDHEIWRRLLQKVQQGETPSWQSLAREMDLHVDTLKYRIYRRIRPALAAGMSQVAKMPGVS